MDQKILIYKILILLTIFFFYNTLYANEIVKGKAKVIDGDTIHININKIRLHGIDAPEYNQNCFLKNEILKCGIESKLFLEKIIGKKEVKCMIMGTDRYNRYIGNCYSNNIHLNKFMVRNGWAIAYTYYSMDFVDQENLAKKEKKGIWQGKFEEPYLFRKNN